MHGRLLGRRDGARRTDADGIKGVYVSAIGGETGAYAVRLDSQGKEIGRERLLRGWRDDPHCTAASGGTACARRAPARRRGGGWSSGWRTRRWRCGRRRRRWQRPWRGRASGRRRVAVPAGAVDGDSSRRLEHGRDDSRRQHPPRVLQWRRWQRAPAASRPMKPDGLAASPCTPAARARCGTARSRSRISRAASSRLKSFPRDSARSASTTSTRRGRRRPVTSITTA